ncbi:alpha-D-glucose phosphate-specific phosphoglucomutase [Gammaproteobacteria bacterium LSUCC0057]|uniref:phosphoglucomutase (alpha-D-glucose-1,6-bisphosphate-dependent) n=1 Tax=Gammaproteobacteria bacterium LSUCC0057 TaxID=2559237 RepID=A0A4Y8UKM0_9GAMM|nr:alpha-D-glucose phosphate-specific phosphoglucomutase [Gammaproteobacteria bacterium LSUCC0057]
MHVVASHPFAGQQPGTSGLRKKVTVFQQPHYLENFIQAVFTAVPALVGATLVVGGDGRFFNLQATQTIIKMAAANGVAKVIVGAGGLLSTPAASALIRQRHAAGGLILSASHNPGGADGDFGVKFNSANGGPAPAAVTDAIYAASLEIDSYRTVASADLELDKLGSQQIAAMQVEVVDPVADYAELMASLFDFAAIARLLAKPDFKFVFDAMHAVTGPYAEEIFTRRLGLPSQQLLNCQPQLDFGGGHPDPNLAHAGDLIAALAGVGEFALAAASDGDGDRNMVLASELFINPCDSIALLAANAHCVPAYREGLAGVARSMPTSRALDRVAAKLQLPCYETPTGWKYFGSLLDAGKITLCGEESFGSGSDHIREKDGLWAVLFWLNIIAVRGLSPRQLLAEHWTEYGRDFFSRHDYEGLPSDDARSLLADLHQPSQPLVGRRWGALTLLQLESFTYTDPVDNSRADKQGLIFTFEDDSRAVLRLSGTGTSGATLRLYFDRYSSDSAQYWLAPQQALAATIAAISELLQLEQRFGRHHPDVIT